MKPSNQLLRGLLFLALLAGLCAGLAAPRLSRPAKAAPVLAQAPLCASGTNIATWTFDGAVTPDIPPPSIGSGTIRAGSGLSNLSYPDGEIAAEDPAISYESWNTTTLDTTAYLEFLIDTTGRDSIGLNFKHRRSGTGPTTLELRYSIDGTNFLPFGSAITLPNDTDWHSLILDLSPISDIDNKSNVAIRLFGYGATNAGGTWRLDNIIFKCLPMVTIDAVTPVLTDSGTAITWHAYDNGPYSLRVGGTDCSNGTVVDSGTYSTSPSIMSFAVGAASLAEGVNTLRVCVTDALGNTGSAIASVTKDTIAPSINAFTRQNPSATPTNADSLIFRATFSEAVNAVDSTDFAVQINPVPPTPPTVTLVTPISPSVYDVTVSGGDLASFNGVVELDLDVAPGDITDIIGFSLPDTEPLTDQSYTLDNTLPPVTYLDVLINEIGWPGTPSFTGDQWIELYNTRSAPVDLAGWILRMTKDGVPTDLVTFVAGDTIPAGGFYLLARPITTSCSDTSPPSINIFTNVTENKCLEAALPRTGTFSVVLELFDNSGSGSPIDTANLGKSSGWYQGSSSTNAPSMERRGRFPDGSSAWVTYGVTAGNPSALNRNGTAQVRGTPGAVNWFTTVTPTPTRTPAATRRPPTPIPPPLVGRPIINEFLPRPGFDWNHDGAIDVFDEFIEVKNIGPVSISIGGWQLDDEAGIGSSPFTLPSITLQPGERALFYGLQTNILLSDGGDSVRLLSNTGVIMDAYTYGVVKERDQSWCRLPEGRDWYDDCVPTPNQLNSREGSVPSMPPDDGLQAPICQFPDTVPPDILFAECNGYGVNMWNAMYWDEEAWQGDKVIPDNESKWLSFIE